MGMPAGGGSSWAHSHDSIHLLDDDDLTWGVVQAAVGRQSLSLLLPLGDSPQALSFVLSMRAERGQVIVSDHHPLVQREARWTLDTSPADLFPHREIRRLGDFAAFVAGAPLVATIEVAPGEIEVLDARGTSRLRVGLGNRSWPHDALQGVIAEGEVALATFAVPGRVKVVATSMP